MPFGVHLNSLPPSYRRLNPTFTLSFTIRHTPRTVSRVFALSSHRHISRRSTEVQAHRFSVLPNFLRRHAPFAPRSDVKPVPRSRLTVYGRGSLDGDGAQGGAGG